MLCASSSAFAANLIDQNAPANNAYMAGFQQTNLAQSFQQTNGNLSGAGIFLQNGVGSGTASITIGLWTALPNQFGAVELASATDVTSSSNHWFDVFWSPVAVTPGATYFLTFDSTSDYGISGDVNNGYPKGFVYANPGYGAFTGYDYTFRTYASDTFSVPEPAIWALMLGGFGLAGAALRRGRATTVRA